MFGRTAVAAFCALAAIMQGPSTAWAQPSREGWRLLEAPLVAPEQAQPFVESQAPASTVSTASFAAGQLTSAGSAAISPEIQELANGLRGDPQAIYDYVRNNIGFTPYFGSRKGATLTLLEGAGNDFDQASLLVALLRASGHTANYVWGWMRLPASEAAAWLGADNDTTILSAIIGSAGMRASVTTVSVELNRVWVVATVDHVQRYLDPAFKRYVSSPPANLLASSGYDRAELLAAVSSGASVTSDYTQQLNEAALHGKLAEYSGNIATALRGANANKSLAEVLGSPVLVRNAAPLGAGLPFQNVAMATWSEIPDEYSAKLTLEFEAINYTFKLHEVVDRRLTVTFAGADHRPELRLAGSLIAAGRATVPGSFYTATVTIDHPFAAFNGTYADQVMRGGLMSGATYALVTNLGGTSQAVLKASSRALDAALSQGLAPSSETVLGESLRLIGLNWVHQKNAAGALVSNMLDAVPMTFHMFAFVGQTSSYNINGLGWNAAVKPRRAGAEAISSTLFTAWGHLNSAFEHGVLESLAGADRPGVSTIKMLQLQNAAGGKVFKVTQANFAALRPVLSKTYDTAFLDEVAAKTAQGAYFLLPENGRQTVQQWAGRGYFEQPPPGGYPQPPYQGTLGGWLILGNLFGGFGTCVCAVDSGHMSANSNLVEERSDLGVDRLGNQVVVSEDPVDLYSGAWIFGNVDLELGGAAPLGLSLGRSYSSGLSTAERSLGFGWAHSYDWFVKRSSDLSLAYGVRQPLDATAALTYFQVSTDLLQAAPDDLLSSMTAMLASKWLVDYLLDNVAIVYQGSAAAVYTKLPGGGYASPPGSTTTLTRRPDNTFELHARHLATVSFDVSDRAIRVVDPDGSVLSLTYNGDDLQQVRDAFGRTITFSYTGRRLTQVSDSASRTVRYAYDAAGNLTEFTDAEGHVWRYEYDNQHRVTLARNPLFGQTVVTNIYDSLGRVSQQLFPRTTGVAAFRFYYGGDRTTEADFDGHDTTTFFDAAGRPIRRVDASGAVSTSTYDGQGHLTAVTDPRGNTTRHEYDARHNRLRTTNARGEITTFEYDAQDRLVRQTDPAGRLTTWAYDGEHHLVQSRDATGTVTTFAYTPNGLRQSQTNGNLVTTEYTRDGAGNVASTRVGQHPPAVSTYDAAGRIATMADRAGATTRHGYDARGLRTSVTDPMGRVSSNVYDAAGHLVSRTDRMGSRADYGRTVTGQLASVSYPGGVVTWTYDRHDRPVRSVGPLGETTYAYDGVGRAVSVVNHRGLTVRFQYDAAGNLAELTYPGGLAVQYGYDTLNRLVSVRNWLGQTATYQYDVGGRMVQFRQFNGIVTTYAYDAAHRLIGQSTAVAGGALATYTIEVDAIGNRTRIDRNEPLALADAARTVDYAFNPERNRLMVAGSTGYTYDNEGRLTLAGATPFTFDALHRLVAFGGHQFTYDAVGQRAEATRAGVVTRYVYDLAGNVIAETDAANVITRYYVHGQGLIGAITAGNDVYSYHFDPSGNTIAVTSSTQQVVNRYAYEPFGAVADQIEAWPQPFKFVGDQGVIAEANGLYFMRARYYDSVVGRFISEDPKGAAGGDLNLYAYSGNNPIRFADPSGMTAVSVDGGGANSSAGRVPDWLIDTVEYTKWGLIVGAVVFPGPGTIGAAIIVQVIDIGMTAVMTGTGQATSDDVLFKNIELIGGAITGGLVDVKVVKEGTDTGLDLGMKLAEHWRESKAPETDQPLLIVAPVNGAERSPKLRLY